MHLPGISLNGPSCAAEVITQDKKQIPALNNFNLNFILLLLKINKIRFFGGSGQSRVQPFQVICGQLVLPEGIVYENAFPLSALRLVRRDCVGIFQLKSVIIMILPDGVISFLLVLDGGVIL